MTEHVRVIQTGDTTQLLDGDCGVVLTVLKACPRRTEQCAALRLRCGDRPSQQVTV
jgi:hypothetical protein